jgi:FKBP-type peptidyl-prolyl cis-trans isomerase
MNFKPVLMAVAVAASFTACQTGSHAPAKLTTTVDSTSYALGVVIGDMEKQRIDMTPGTKDLNMDILLSAIGEKLKGEETQISADDARKVIQDYFTKAQQAEATENLKKGEEFLAANKEKPGITTTESGLQYEVLVEGTGPKPTLDDKVKCHYTGTLIDGTVFDSSVERKEPATFQVKGVIKGWTEALQLMPVGSKWKLYIPAELAYGERGAGQDIGPNETLIFEIELLEIVK